MFAGNIKGIAAGSLHSIVVTTDGDVWTTGANNYGQLGDGTRTDKNRFTKVVGIVGTWDMALGNAPSTCTNLPVHAFCNR